MSIIQNLWNWLTSAFYKVKHQGIDISHWNPMTDAEWADRKAHGLQFVWIAMCNGVWEDNLFREHVRQARKFNVPFAVYIWLDPTVDAIRQAIFGLTLLKSFAPDACNYMVDDEQKYEYQNGTGRRLPGEQILAVSKAYLDYVANRITIPLVIYSGTDMMQYVCPGLAEYTKYYYYINASYADNIVVTLTWPAFLAYLTNVRRPTIPATVKMVNVDGHQLTSVKQIDNGEGEVYERIDVDAVQDDAVFAELWGTLPPPVVMPPIPTPPPVVTPPPAPVIPPTPIIPPVTIPPISLGKYALYKKYRWICYTYIRNKSDQFVTSHGTQASRYAQGWSLILYTLTVYAYSNPANPTNGWMKISPTEDQWIWGGNMTAI